MKFFILILLILQSFLLFSQHLEITSDGQVFVTQSSPNENWLIAKEGNQYKIYEGDFNLVDTFNLGAHQNSVQWIYGAARDFDNDENIEILYQVNIDNIVSMYLKDIQTGQIQVQYAGNASYWYYCNSYGYLDDERIFSISRYNLDNYNYDASYTYRSENPQASAPDDVIPYTNLKNFPNPFSPTHRSASVNIIFSLESSQEISLKIYNAKGQCVKTLLESDKLTVGKHSVIWNGADYTGKLLPSGVYFYKLEANGQTTTKKIVMIK